MNIYDNAHELATALNKSPEVIKYREESQKISSNENSKKMVDDFRKMQIEAYTEQMNKGSLSKETEDKLQKVGSVIMMNPDVAAFIMAEQKFGQMWEEIMKILKDGIGMDMNF